MPGTCLRASLLLLLSLSPACGELPSFSSDAPEIAFDLPPTLECRDVTPADFAAAHPEQRIIRVEAPITLLLYHGEPRRIDDVVIEIDGGDALRVFDYAPRTTLASEHAEPIEEKRTVHTDKTIAASLGGKLSGDVALTPTVSSGVSRNESKTETFTRLPPKEAVVVSGAIDGRTGVYFKLRRSSQSTLEGERLFTVDFVAPADWSGGEVEVRCVARGERRWLLVEKRGVWNETAQPVELRLVSHTVAKPEVGE